MTTPAFVLKSEFELPGTNAKGYAGIVDYMTDKEKVKKGEAYNTPDYFPEGILSYMADEKKASGLFTKDKDFVDKNSIRELKESYQQAEQNGSLQWKFVGSFDNEWLKENQILDSDGDVREQALKKAVRVMMERLIKEEKFIPSQTIWAASFHHNTDNLHFHISLVEKKNSRELVKRRKQKVEKSLSPTGMQIRFYRDQGDVCLQPKGKLKQATLDKMKSSFLNELTRSSRKKFLAVVVILEPRYLVMPFVFREFAFDWPGSTHSKRHSSFSPASFASAFLSAVKIPLPGPDKNAFACP